MEKLIYLLSIHPNIGKINQLLKNMTTSLHQAIKDNDLDRVRSLISTGSNITKKNTYDATLLHYASAHGNF